MPRLFWKLFLALWVSIMAFVVLTSRVEEEAEMIAIAHYLKDPRTNFADSAFLVRDDWQGRGVGTLPPPCFQMKPAKLA